MEINEKVKRSKDSAAMLNYWDKTDAIIEGYEAIKAGGELYLPKFTNEPDDDYNTRLRLTKFTNIYRDVLEGLAAKPFEREVTIKDENIPTPVSEFIENVDGSGNNLTIFAATTFFNGLNSAIDWIFVDYPTVDTNLVRTVADVKKAGIRPFWSHVLGRNVLEAKTEIIAGLETLSYIRIFEPGSPDKVRIFQRSQLGQVTWELWRKVDNAKKVEEQYVLETSGVLSINVIPLIPFITGRRDGKTFKLFPAMQDAADLQITLYQDESALQFIKTMAGYPMLAANGMKPEMDATTKQPKKIAIGPMKVLYGTPDNNGNHGSWNYIEPSATSMTFLKDSIKDTKSDLRELGRQPLTAQSGQLTVITTAVAAGKAKSAVSAWSLGLKDALENALKITCMWMGIQFEPEVDVYNEFDNFTDNNADLTALATMREKGDLSQSTYWEEMKRRKVLSSEFDEEEEKLKLLGDIPADDNNPDLENPTDANPTKPKASKTPTKR